MEAKFLKVLLYTGLLAICAGQDLSAVDHVIQNGCHHELFMKEERHVELHLGNFTSRSRSISSSQLYCTVLISTKPGLRIVVDLLYRPAYDAKKPANTNCIDDYVHVGNDVRRVDSELMTSYKFCHVHVQEEILSRGDQMWLVYKASRVPQELRISFRAKIPVRCQENEFTCSPVQCVASHKVCDGVRDCSNGHDEFCHRKDMHSTPSPQKHNMSCFLCRDGTCIEPRLPVYHNSHGRKLWYLCDGFPHCPDGWDELMEMCGRNPRGQSSKSVISCVPFDLQFGPRGEVIMWDKVKCDNTLHCYHGEDEESCAGLRVSDFGQLRASPEMISVVSALVVLIVLTGVVVYRILSRTQPLSRPSTSSTADTLCTVCTSGDSDGETAHPQGTCCEAQTNTTLTVTEEIRHTSV